MTLGYALFALVCAIAGLLRAFLSTRELLALRRRLRSAGAGELFEGRARWGAPHPDGRERLFVERNEGDRAEIDVRGADVVAVRPTRARLFEEGASILAIGGMAGEISSAGRSEWPVIHGAVGRRAIVTNLSREEIDRWATRMLRRTRPVAVACFVLTLVALLATAVVAKSVG